MPRRRRSGYRPGVTFKAIPSGSPLPGGPPWSAPAGAPRPCQDPVPCTDLMHGGRNGGTTLAQPSLGDAGAASKREPGGPTQSNSSCASEATQFGNPALTPAGLCAARASAPDLGALGLGETLNPIPILGTACPRAQDAPHALPLARARCAPTALSLEQLLECFGQRPGAQAQSYMRLAAAAARAAASATAAPAQDARASAPVCSSVYEQSSGFRVDMISERPLGLCSVARCACMG